MNVNKRIKQARVELQYSESVLAERCGLTIYELGDVEARADEFSTAIASRNAILLCRELKISIKELLELLDAPDETSANLPRLPEYVRTVRSRAELSAETLDDLLGYEQGFVSRIESGALDLCECPLVVAIDIAEQTRSSRSCMLQALERAVQ